jgi:hypothetical protein
MTIKRQFLVSIPRVTAGVYMLVLLERTTYKGIACYKHGRKPRASAYVFLDTFLFPKANHSRQSQGICYSIF